MPRSQSYVSMISRCMQDNAMNSQRASRIGAICYAAWGFFHRKLAYEIYRLGTQGRALAQGRLFQLAAYMLSIALFAIVVAARCVATGATTVEATG